ncbi:NUDIX hydrolase [Bradyrhizobium sp. 25ACV]
MKDAFASMDVDQRIRRRATTQVSPWITLVERTVHDSRGELVGNFHGLALADYISIIAISSDGQVPLVRQFRPAVEQWTLEFPGGLLDAGEDPQSCAIRELFEETGLEALDATSLGAFLPDSGRLGNRLWGFFASGVVPAKGWMPEPEVEVEYVSVKELDVLVRDGTFNHAPHLALFAVARLRGLI